MYKKILAAVMIFLNGFLVGVNVAYLMYNENYEYSWNKVIFFSIMGLYFAIWLIQKDR